MKKIFTLIALLAMVVSGAWADLTENTVINCDFSNGETLFTNPSRVTIQNSATNQNLELVAAYNAANGNAGAKFNFGDKLSTGVKQLKISFDCFLGNNTSGFWAIGEASKRTYTGSGTNGYSNTGTIFSIGINRASSTNWLRVNDVTLGASYNAYLASWIHVDLSIDLESKTQTYKVTKTDDASVTIASATGVAFKDETVSSCDIIDFFTAHSDGKNKSSLTYYFDNLLIKEYYDASATYYTATFVENNSLNPSIALYDNEARTSNALNGSLESGKTYYYTATLTGYNDYLGSFTVADSDPTVNFTMTEKPRFTFTVNAVDANGVVKALFTDAEAYDGKTGIAVVAPKYLTDANNKVTHSKNNDTYYVSYTASQANPTQAIEYTAYEGDAYFVEIENVITNATNVTSGNYSSNKAVRGIASARNVFTIPQTGKYKLTYAVCNNNVTYSTEAIVYRNNTENVIASSGDIKSISLNYVKTSGTKSQENIYLFEGDNILIKGSTTNLIFDYILLEKTGEATVPVTISGAGYATFVAPYNVDFTGNAIEAFAVSAINANTVTLANVTTVPAGEAVIVRGATGTVNVVASADAITNLMKAATVAIEFSESAENINYVLANGANGVGLYPVTSGTIVAGKGYLPVPKNSANSKGFEFVEDNATDAGVVEATPVAVKNGKYTENGQIVIFINGKKYNVAGMNK